jgi:hypothetical protein
VPPERFSDSGDEFDVSERDLESGLLGAWVLLTTEGIRWHYTVDGAPEIRPGIGADFGGGVRSARRSSFIALLTDNQSSYPTMPS